MIVEQVEKVKQEYTDKYVKVDANRAELARFKDIVGRVKTVNMSGRALVEFLDYNQNIGWYDIDLDYLKVVDKPEPKPAEAKKPAAKKPAPKKPAAATEKKLSPLEMARQADSGGKKKQSTADVLAALRGGAKAKPAEPKAEQPAAKEKPAPAKPAATGEAMDRSKMSVAEMIAAAKGQAAPAEAETEQAEEQAITEEPTVEAAAPAEESPAAAPAAAGRVDKSSMSVEEMVAYCREHDA